MLSGSFPNCSTSPIGLYPIVDSAAWLEKLLPLGVTTIQLRIKNKAEREYEKEIQKAITIAKQFSTRLFINDDWELAIKYHAYGVHLGQEDLKEANIEKIHQAGLRLGISTHSKNEIKTALALRPSYLAYGPIYETASKTMSFSPQGIEKLKAIIKIIPNTIPIVAIGGINLDHFDDVVKTGVNGVAIISAITQAEDPIEMTKKFLGKF